MPKPIKWILAILAAAVLLIVVAVIIAPMVIHLDSYKPQLEKQISKYTGRPFSLDGEIKPTLFPWIGVGLTDLHLGNPADFDKGDFVSKYSAGGAQHRDKS